MNKRHFLAFVFYALILNLSANENQSRITVNTGKINDNTQSINLKFNLNKDESIYSASINISTDNPSIKLSDWKTSNNILSSKTLNQDFNINLTASRTDKETDKYNLYISYLLTNQDQIKDENFVLNFQSTNEQNKINKNLTETNKQVPNKTEYISIPNDNKEQPKKTFWSYLLKLSTYTQELVKTSNSIWIQIFLVFLLGLLMSFTPCIYPVIPITAGILQMQGSKSVLRNFALSIAYAFGIATTFATFGLTAALSGHLFGQILTHPIFVIFISAFLIYLAFSMFGFYDMYVPKFLNTSKSVKHKGSLGSAFIFGAVSGSIASPCLSPGLALLLTIVAALANKFLGFLLLFSFGIGLSIPLIIIGTFSGSINKLPRAGIWMDEVKKVFGFLLIGMTFYYLNNILPFYILLWLISITLFVSGIAYLYSIKSYDSKALAIFKNFVGFCLIASAIFAASKAYQKTFFSELEKVEEDIWLNDYNAAIEQAKQNKKKLIIDIGASFCTLCKAIDKQVFNNPEIKKHLKDFALVKVDATDSQSEPFVSLKAIYGIIGVPTILIINPNNGDLLKRFEGELYDTPKQEVINELIKLK